MTELTKLTERQAQALENAQAKADGTKEPHSLRQRGGGNSVGRMVERLAEAGLVRERYLERGGHITDRGRQVLAAHQARKADLAAKREAAAAKPVKPAKLAGFFDISVARLDLPHPYVQGVAVWCDGTRNPFTWRTGESDVMIYTNADSYRDRRNVTAPRKVAAILAAIEAVAQPAIEAARADHTVIEAERERRREARLAWHLQRVAGPALFAATGALASAAQAMAVALDAAGVGDPALIAQATAAIDQAGVATINAVGGGLHQYKVGESVDRLHTVVTAADIDQARAAYAYGTQFARGYNDGPLPVRPVDVVAELVAG